MYITIAFVLLAFFMGYFMGKSHVHDAYLKKSSIVRFHVDVDSVKENKKEKKQ